MEGSDRLRLHYGAVQGKKKLAKGGKRGTSRPEGRHPETQKLKERPHGTERWGEVKPYEVKNT